MIAAIATLLSIAPIVDLATPLSKMSLMIAPKLRCEIFKCARIARENTMILLIAVFMLSQMPVLFVGHRSNYMIQQEKKWRLTIISKKQSSY